MLFLLTATIATSAPPAEIHVCSLFPKWFRDGSAPRAKGHRRLAILQAALRSINNDTTLLPNTRLLLQHGDSRCDQLTAMAEATRMVQHAFGGAGCDVIIGAACSSASKGVATVSTLGQTPQISYSSTSPELSDSVAYPYLMRVCVSDTLQSTALAGLVRHLLRVNRVATIASSDLYGRTGIEAFHQTAAAEEIDILATVRFDKGTSEADLRLPGGPIDIVRASGVRAIVLFCHEADARRVIRAARAEGIGGQNYTWIGSETVSQLGASFFDTFPSGTLGYVGIEPAPAATSAHATYASMAASLPSHAGNGSDPSGWTGGCDLERDDGGELLWAYDDGSGRPYRCGGVASQAGDSYGKKRAFLLPSHTHPFHPLSLTFAACCAYERIALEPEQALMSTTPRLRPLTRCIGS